MLDRSGGKTKRKLGYMRSFERPSPKKTSLEEKDVASRADLPIHHVGYQVMESIHNNDTIILVGETGCGKSTQVPQYCVRMGLAKNGRVGVTQPRRLAAISLANRVATEMNTSVGEEVGYHVRFEKKISATTQIAYLTDGILLREAIHDPLLREYSTVIVDEAHERSLHTDILLNQIGLLPMQEWRIEENAGEAARKINLAWATIRLQKGRLVLRIVRS
ncbi:hypothetical protein KIN20_036852 [Parelaphostrongylus tenuis]|uniref:RNA helicase n=2 Tax=Parelaphostrongylus tenuis TaxID=148309 RepID=A0AAD5RD54_PARTN|nr:hypothetical protein KIN20_036852 [Parelaphostrongylus tenuis]